MLTGMAGRDLNDDQQRREWLLKCARKYLADKKACHIAMRQVGQSWSEFEAALGGVGVSQLARLNDPCDTARSVLRLAGEDVDA